MVELLVLLDDLLLWTSGFIAIFFICVFAFPLVHPPCRKALFHVIVLGVQGEIGIF